MDLFGMNIDLLGASASVMGTVVVMIVVLFFIVLYLIKKNYDTFDKDVVIIRGKNKIPSIYRGRVIEQDGAKYLEIASDMFKAFFRNTILYPVSKINVELGKYDVFWFEANVREELIPLKISDVSIDDIKNTEFLTKKEISALKKLKLAPESMFSCLKFEEVINPEYEQYLTSSAVDSAARTQKPAGLWEKYGVYLILIVAAFVAYLILDSTNKYASDIQSKNVELQKAYIEEQREFKNLLYTGGFCTKYCTNSSYPSVISPER